VKPSFLSLLFFFGACVFVYADKKQIDKHYAQEYVVPIPDPICRPDAPAVPIKAVPEVRMHNIRPYHEPSIYGIDVSHHQGSINWNMVATDSKAGYVYIKGTESTSHVDSEYERNLREAKKMGIPVGTYHFFSPKASGLVQFQNFSSNFDINMQDLIPVIDVEHRGRVSLAYFHTQLKTLLEEIERAYGVRPIIYTGVNFYNSYLSGMYKKYKFFIARYNSETQPELCDDVPIVMWQFTSEGYINGIRGHVDRSCLLDNYSLQDIMLPR
jgi:lysozyme